VNTLSLAMKAILLTLACISVCQAQTPAEATVTLEGQVASTTGGPLKNVFVQLAPRPDKPISGSEIYSVVTGASGGFVFDSLPAGRYAIMAQRSGYIIQGWRDLTIDPSQPPAPVSIQLTPFGRIEGKVTDEDGEPYRGQISVEGVGQTEISADGTFVIEAAAGHYYVRAMDPNPRLAGEMTGTWPREVDTATYYPSSTTTSGATRVNVPAGAIVRGIDIRIRRVTAYTVRGHAIDASTGKPAVNMEIQLALDGRQLPPWQMTTATTLADGSFEFKDVQPATYSVSATRSRIADDIVPQALYSLQPVVVGKENVEDLEIALQRGAEIRGKISMESGEPVKPAVAWRVTLGSGNGNRGGQVQNDGSFVLSDLAPRKYVVQIFGQPPQTYVKSVRLNQQELTDRSIDLSSGTGGNMEVVLSPHVAEVSGVIRDASGVPVTHVPVTLWKPGQSGNQALRAGDAQTDANGAFRIGNLGPGEYRIAAWARSPAVTPELLSEFDGRAAIVKLVEDARVNVDAPLMPKEAIDEAEENRQ
jgi:5-hydroxyisourate hydrolase-like protein (transthyretin family)